MCVAYVVQSVWWIIVKVKARTKITNEVGSDPAPPPRLFVLPNICLK